MPARPRPAGGPGPLRRYHRGVLPPAAPGGPVGGPDARRGRVRGVDRPQYETPAEIRMHAPVGADLVGMSTVFETIAARHLGVEVLGHLAGHQHGRRSRSRGRPTTPRTSLAVGRQSAERMGALLAEMIAQILADAESHPNAPTELRAPAEAWASEDPDPRTRAEIETLLSAGDTEPTRRPLRRPARRSAPRGSAARSAPGRTRMNRRSSWRDQRGGGGSPLGPGAGRPAWSSASTPATARTSSPTTRRGCSPRRGCRVRASPRSCPPRCWRSPSAQLGADAGVMITASHNPPQTTGTRSTWATGRRSSRPTTARSRRAIERVGPLREIRTAPTRRARSSPASATRSSAPTWREHRRRPAQPVRGLARCDRVHADARRRPGRCCARSSSAGFDAAARASPPG